MSDVESPPAGISPAGYEPPPGSIPTLGVPSLDGLARVHFVGIGGAGMSGIARLLLARGVTVTGSDLKASRILGHLGGAGARTFVGHRADQVCCPDPPDAVVVSSAIPDRNAEVVEARRLGIPVLARAQLLAALAAEQRTFAVSGTHGKTTTTSMLSVILDRAGLDPTFVIGGDLNESGSGARHGAGGWFVAEADESDGSFLLLSPEVAVVTNVEEDHLDFYRDGDEIRAAFAAFLERCGTVVACGDDTGTREALRRSGRDAVTYGTHPSNDAVLAIGAAGREGGQGTLVLPEGGRMEIRLRVPGAHNLLNAAGAIIAARFAGVEPEDAARALASFTGVRRRFEFRGAVRDAQFFDDYAHHPTEVEATIRAAEKDGRRLIAVFQPHRYTRTRAMWRQLGESLAGADLVVVTDVYGAGEQPIPGITGKLLVDALAEAAPGKRLLYLPHRAALVAFLVREVRPGDLVLTLGAGDITTVADEALELAGEGIPDRNGARGR